MASKYAKRLVVPPEFPGTLSSFTRELLRDLPPDVPDGDAVVQWILEYGAQFFEARAESGDGGARDVVADIARLNPDELREQITQIFLEADVDNNGYLDHKEFKTVVSRFTRDLGLSGTDARRVMAEADENADGCIEYHEFVPLAVDVIQVAIAKRKFEESKLEREADAVSRSRHFLLHGMSRDELESVLRDMFKQADVDGSGFLNRTEFATCLRNSGLGLTRKEINVLLAEVDADEDGRVTYEEFLPLCFNLLVEIVSEEFENSSIPSGEADLKEFFLALFSSADVERTGLLRPYDLQTLVKQADLGLTSIQLSALMAEAVTDEEGFVRYETFAGDAATIIASIIDVQTTQSKAERLAEMRARSEHATVMGMTQDAFEGAIADAMASRDESGSGRVHAGDAMEVLLAIGLSDKESVAIVSLDPPAEDGTMAIAVIARSAFFVMQQIQEMQEMRGW